VGDRRLADFTPIAAPTSSGNTDRDLYLTYLRATTPIGALLIPQKASSLAWRIGGADMDRDGQSDIVEQPLDGRARVCHEEEHRRSLRLISRRAPPTPTGGSSRRRI
jgi:hypothetical protein